MSDEKIAIIVDSSADLSPEELQDFGWFCMELKVLMPDGSILPTGYTPEMLDLFWSKLENTDELPSTSMANQADFEAMLAEVEQQGYTHAIILPISSGISGTLEAAEKAAEASSMNAVVIDSRNATTPFTVLCYRVKRLQDEGYSFEQLCDAIPKIIDEVHLWLPLDTVKNLVKGGRTTHMAGIASAVLDIKPILGFNKEGHLVSFTKVRSTKKARKELVKHFQEMQAEKGQLEGFFFHTNCEEGCDEIRAMFNEVGLDYIELGSPRNIGPVVATHLGAGAAGWACVPVNVQLN